MIGISLAEIPYLLMITLMILEKPGTTFTIQYNRWPGKHMQPYQSNRLQYDIKIHGLLELMVTATQEILVDLAVINNESW